MAVRSSGMLQLTTQTRGPNGMPNYRCTMERMSQQDSDRKMRKTLIWVAIAAGVIVVVAFVAAAWNGRTIPFTPALWASGKGVYTQNNPRMRMEQEVCNRLNSGQLTRAQVQALLGPPDVNLSIENPKTGTASFLISYTLPAGGYSGEWQYILGVQPNSALVGRSLQILWVSFDRRGTTGGYVSGLDFPEGSRVVVAKPKPPAKPKVAKTKAASSKKAP